eukprot:7514805-Pyramimonas_sp.AAC.2
MMRIRKARRGAGRTERIEGVKRQWVSARPIAEDLVVRGAHHQFWHPVGKHLRFRGIIEILDPHHHTEGRPVDGVGGDRLLLLRLVVALADR